MTRRLRPIFPRRFCLNMDQPSRNDSSQGNRTGASTCFFCSAFVMGPHRSISDPWIKVRVQDIHYQVGNKDNNGNQKKRGLCKRVVILTDSRDQFPSNARPGEHRLGQRPPVYGKSKTQTNAGNNRQGGIGRCVMVSNRLFLETFGPCREDIIFLEGFQHAAAHDQQIRSEVDQEQGT